MIMGLLIASCNHDEGASFQDLKTAEYSSAFVKEFGQPNSNQTWGDWSAQYNAETRTSNVEGNRWSSFVEVPSAITAKELQDVLNVFNSPIYEENDITVNWSDFFVQQVYKGQASYTAKNGGSIGLGSNHMDHLICYKEDGTSEHINNFNRGDNTDWGGLTLMQNSGTYDFAYSNSEDSKYHHEYIIKEIGGNYYIGFDFYGNGQYSNMQIDRDHIYNDWIIKICPATYKSAKRVIAEDLGQIGDFDFNDVVFDAYLEWNSAVITILAAGGTLPLYVGPYEVHDALGINRGSMANTSGKEGNLTVKPAIVRINQHFNSIKDIPITVENNGAFLILSAEDGHPAQKICISGSFRWPKGKVNIKSAYPKFKDWVTTESNYSTSSWDSEYVNGMVY